MILTQEPDPESGLQPFGNSGSGIGSSKKWNHSTSNCHIPTDLVLCPVVDLLHPAQELDGRPGLLGHVVAQLDVLALHRDGQRDGP